MNRQLEKHYIQDGSHFRTSGTEKHEFIDCWRRTSVGTSPIQLRQGVLAEKDISPWLRKNDSELNVDHRLAFRMLILSARKVGFELVLPISSSTFQEIALSWHFPPLVLCTICQPYSVATFFSPAYRSSQNNGAGIGIIVRMDNNWERECVIVVTQNPDDKLVTVVCAGLIGSDIPAFRQSVLDSLQVLENPMAVPSILLTALCHDQTTWLDLISPQLMYVQVQIGMANWIFGEESPFFGMKKAEDPSELDLAQIMTNLQRMADSIGFRVQIIAMLQETLDMILEEMKNGRSDGLLPKNEVGEEIAQTIMLLVKSLKGCGKRIDYTRGTIDGLIHTIYTLISQRDSKLNLEIASHSRRDSIDMRIIAAVTMFFLPGTFIATFFGTSFFDFQAEHGRKILSQWHWIYWTITFATTAVVLGGWYFFSALQSRKATSFVLAKATNDMRFDNIGAIAGGQPTYNTTEVPDNMRRKRRLSTF